MASRFREFWVVFRQNKGALIGLGVLIAILLAAGFGPVILGGDPFEMVGPPSHVPGGEYLLGTDVLGRSIATGLVHGARVSLLVGTAAALCATLVGIVVGALAGYIGGIVDDVLMRVTDFFLTIPSFMLTILLVAIFSASLESIIASIAAVSWPSIARLTRAEFLQLKEREFTLALKSMGMRDSGIIFRQLLPNALPSIVVVASLLVGTAILTESSLSFLGLGDPNVMSWGTMIGVGREVLRSAWWMTAIPGVAILITVLAINLIGEGLNDALNPRLRVR